MGIYVCNCFYFYCEKILYLRILLFLLKKKVYDSIYKGVFKYILYVIGKELDWIVKEKYFEYKFKW